LSIICPDEKPLDRSEKSNQKRGGGDATSTASVKRHFVRKILRDAEVRIV
jgi:hypothetical protein